VPRRAGKIDTILTTDPERLSRDTGQLFALLDVFQKTGVRVAFRPKVAQLGSVLHCSKLAGIRGHADMAVAAVAPMSPQHPGQHTPPHAVCGPDMWWVIRNSRAFSTA